MLNAGGHPRDGTILASANYRISLDAVGDSIAGIALGSASFQMDGGLVTQFPPPGEIRAMRFADKQTLEWDVERSVGAYNLYRDLLSVLGAEFGTCQQPGLGEATATVADPVPTNDGYFYLATAVNRLDEEGTKGYRGDDGSERPNTDPCP